MLLLKLPPLPKSLSFRPSNPLSFSSRRLSLSSELKLFDFDFDLFFLLLLILFIFCLVPEKVLGA